MRGLVVAGSAIIALAGVFLARRAFGADNFAMDEPPELIVRTQNSNIPRVVWSQIQYFTESEYRGEIDDVDPRLVYAADRWRGFLGVPACVTPVKGGIARKGDDSKTSQHYAVGRKSTATDYYSPQATMRQMYQAALRVPEIGGIGLYPEANPTPLIHNDVRPRKSNGQPAVWMGVRQPEGSDETGWDYVAVDWRYMDDPRSRQVAYWDYVKQGRAFA